MGAVAGGAGRRNGGTGRGGGMGMMGGMGGRGGMVSHEGNWVECCKSGKQANSHFDYSGPFTEAVVMGCLALKYLDQKLLWDGENMVFTNNQQATAYAKPDYRQGWSLDL